MSIITRADLAGSIVMGVVVVERGRRGCMGGEVGVAGWVRSKPVLGEWSQKLDALPMMERRGGAEGVDAIVERRLLEG
jgi:hypothetical protein